MTSNSKNHPITLHKDYWKHRITGILRRSCYMSWNHFTYCSPLLTVSGENWQILHTCMQILSVGCIRIYCTFKHLKQAQNQLNFDSLLKLVWLKKEVGRSKYLCYMRCNSHLKLQFTFSISLITEWYCSNCSYMGNYKEKENLLYLWKRALKGHHQ